jgi:hypothetical protein
MPAISPKNSKSSASKGLESYYNTVKQRFHSNHTKASAWFKKKSFDVDQLRTTSQQLLAAATIMGGVALHQPVDVMLQQQLEQSQNTQNDDSKALAELSLEEHQAILNKMRDFAQRPPGHLQEQEELYLEQQLADMLGFSVAAELDGHRLNHTIGIMGGEQHLKRFPGDTLDQHDAFHEAGMAPNRGSFGWFTENGVLTEKAIQREKYYFAVQTLYLPDWNSNHQNLKPWYKFRKMIAINPAEELAVVGVVGDAGPAKWVNKQFGGSPEIIREAKIWSSNSRGRVILFFVDDPDDTIPLGVINLSVASMYTQ